MGLFSAIESYASGKMIVEAKKELALLHILVGENHVRAAGLMQMFLSVIIEVPEFRNNPPDFDKSFGAHVTSIIEGMPDQYRDRLADEAIKTAVSVRDKVPAMSGCLKLLALWMKMISIKGNGGGRSRDAYDTIRSYESEIDRIVKVMNLEV